MGQAMNEQASRSKFRTAEPRTERRTHFKESAVAEVVSR